MNEPWYIGLDPEQAKRKRTELIRKANPFCDAAPELYGAMSIEDAKQDPRYAHLFSPENEWRMIDGTEQPPPERQLDG